MSQWRCRAVALSRRRAERRGTLDVNRLIRLGLAGEREDATESGRRFSTPTFDSGPALISVDDVAAAIAQSEGEGRF